MYLSNMDGWMEGWMDHSIPASSDKVNNEGVTQKNTCEISTKYLSK